jgi:chemotaxis protein histidine kinase CheA
MVPMLVWAAQEEKKEEKRKENPPPAKVQQQKPQVQQKQQPQVQQRQQPQYQQPKAQPTYQQPKAQPTYQQPKAQPTYQQPKPQPTYQQPKPQPQYQQPKAQPTYQQRQQPQVQPRGQQPQRTLTPTESQQQIQNLNRNRAAMGGINKNPLPQGQVTVRGDGSRIIAASGGRQFQVRPNGTVARVTLSGGRTATFGPNGGVRTIRAGGMQINHGLRGERQIVTVRPDHSRVVSMGPHQGYLERPYLTRNGRTYVQRTYWAGGRPYVRVYRTNYYRGVPYYGYVSPYYYHPGFYFWAYNPWQVPVYYRWPWFAAPPPWYLYYGPYFAPAPMYPTAALWLTDFLLAEDLRLAYEAQRDAQANAAAAQAYQPPPPAAEGQGYTSQITPEMKQAIAEEVRAQLAAEQQGASTAPQQPAPSGTEAPPAALDPARRLFVVPGNLAVTTVDGQDCELTSGDIITRLDDTPDNNNKVRVSVSSSKGGDCGVGSTLMVDVNDLQEMQNQFGEKVDSGLKTLADNSGKAGLPPAPDTGTTAGEVPTPPPDASVGSALQAQQQQADQTENQVQQEVVQGGQN